MRMPSGNGFWLRIIIRRRSVLSLHRLYRLAGVLQHTVTAFIESWTASSVSEHQSAIDYLEHNLPHGPLVALEQKHDI